MDFMTLTIANAVQLQWFKDKSKFRNGENNN